MADTIRPYRRDDADALGQLVHRAIHDGASSAYSPEQCAAWSPAPREGAAFHARIAGQTVLVAEDEAGLSGVFTLTHDGLLDLAFVRPDRMGRGTASALYAAIVDVARDKGLSRLSVEASHLARRFFEKHGWRFLETQTVNPNGVAMQNHRMMLDL